MMSLLTHLSLDFFWVSFFQVRTALSLYYLVRFSMWSHLCLKWMLIFSAWTRIDGVTSWAIPADEAQKHHFINTCGLRADRAGFALQTDEQVNCIARHATTSSHPYRIRHRASTRSSMPALRIPSTHEICECVTPPDCRSASTDVSERCGCNNAETMGDYYCYTQGVCQNASYDPQPSWYYLSTTWRLCELEYSPNDMDFSDQWYVRSHNVISAWKDGYRGGQSTVVIVDDGIDYTHPDLAVDRDLSLDGPLTVCECPPPMYHRNAIPTDGSRIMERCARESTRPFVTIASIYVESHTIPP